MNISSKINLIIVLGSIAFGSVFMNTGLSAQESILTKTFLVESEFRPAVSPDKLWTLAQKMEEKETEFLATPVSVAVKAKIFYENRISGNGKMTRKKLQEEEKDIALKILNLDSGEVKIIKIKIVINKNGLSIISPSAYKITIAPRTNGILWNKWNTMYKISEPAGWIVLKNKYPERISAKKVEERVYTPYSDEIHTAEMVEAGRKYLREVATEAFRDLKEKKVYSRAVPDTLISDLSALNHDIFVRLPLIEGMDFSEFVIDPVKSYERVLVLIGSNKERAYYWTESSASARGWLQYTPKTYKSMAKTYPSAKLMADHKTGASDHVNSMKAAILLHDYNLAELVKKFGNKILDDPRLEEYLAAAYNGNPTWTFNSLRATISKGLPDWVNTLSATRKDHLGGLRNETKGYIDKIRYLKENNLP